MKGKTRRSVVVLAVVAMIAALLAIPVAPAGAASAACDSAPSAGFTDLAGFTAETVNAVDCIAFYGITQGTSATTYGPSADVSRWQMALFLTRKLAAAGVTLPTAADQGFTDIASFDAATKDAINQLAQLNITKGTSATTFDPNGIVNRWQMALFITRQLTAAGIALPAATSQGFTDIAGLDQATQDAINQLAALGISKGTSATTYDPMGNVNRWQMALFLARDLDAMGVVPSGLTLSADKTVASTGTDVVTFTVKYAASNVPVEGQRVDVFATKTFNSDGTAAFDSAATFDTTAAGDGAIDVGDPQTDVNGEITFKLSDATAEDVTVVAWIGDVGDTFDNDLVASADMAMVTISLSLGATSFTATVDGGAAGMAPYATAETTTIQLMNGSSKAKVAGEKFVVFLYRGALQPVNLIATTTLTSDANGQVLYTYTGPADPNAAAGDTTNDWVVVLWDQNGNGIQNGAEPSATLTETWSDAKAAAANVDVDQASLSSLVSTSLTATATVTDQYADPISGVAVEFTAGALVAVRTTNASGVASLTYTGPAAQTQETIDAAADADGDGSIYELASTGFVTHTWVEKSADDVSIDGDIVTVGATYVDLDTTGGSLDGYVRVYFDSNDQFNVSGAGSTMAAFVDSLDVGDNVTAAPYEDGAADVSTFDNVTG